MIESRAVNIQPVVTGILLVLGIGFLVANARLILEYVKFLRRRRPALLIWPSPKPPVLRNGAGSRGHLRAAGVLQSHLPAAAGLRRSHDVPVLYAYLLPLSLRIRRGFYEDGIWADSAFIPYSEVGRHQLAGRQTPGHLIVISRLRNLARRLAVPLDNYAAARRLLRDKIARHDIHFTGTRS